MGASFEQFPIILFLFRFSCCVTRMTNWQDISFHVFKRCQMSRKITPIVSMIILLKEGFCLFQKAEVQWVWAGLRPQRSPIRVESQIMNFNGKKLKVNLALINLINSVFYALLFTLRRNIIVPPQLICIILACEMQHMRFASHAMHKAKNSSTLSIIYSRF